MTLVNNKTPEIVTVVIPSRNRPQLVSRAVRSALAQTWELIEVIVILDGPDAESVKVLSQIEDSRLRVIELSENIGPSGARNAGVSEAKGTWIAFLDDDDEWLPQKLERQLEVAKTSHYNLPVVLSQFIVRTPKTDLIWPKRVPLASEPLSEYLFVRNSFLQGEGFVQTSTFFTKTELLKKIPLNNKLNKHEDWEWLLKVNTIEGVGIEFVSEPLAIWYFETGIKRLSGMNGWKYSLTWIRSIRNLVTPKAYSGFIMTIVSSHASSERDWNAFYLLFWEAIRLGKPRAIDVCLYLIMWLISPQLRHQVHAIVAKLK